MRVFGIVVHGTALAGGAPSSAHITQPYVRVMKYLACLFMGLTLCRSQEVLSVLRPLMTPRANAPSRSVQTHSQGRMRCAATAS
jgi:hypothetical protein